MYNSIFGFRAGDELLCRMGSLLSAAFLDEPAFRFSDDHFVVFSVQTELKNCLYRLRRELRDMEHGLNIELQCGICELEQLESSCEKAKLACDALGDRIDIFYQFYNENLEKTAILQAYVLRNLEQALEQEWISICFQPIIRTLTGGVCRMEAIGCEKVQGYYFGEARIYEETMAKLAERGVSVEPMRMMSYYDAASRVDFVRHRPLALVEDDGISFHHLFANSFYMDSLREPGIERLEEAETWINASGSPLCLQYRAFAEDGQTQPKAGGADAHGGRGAAPLIGQGAGCL